jgi:hypothetical protein
MNDCNFSQFMLWLLAPGAKNSSYVMAWSGNYIVKFLLKNVFQKGVAE